MKAGNSNEMKLKYQCEENGEEMQNTNIGWRKKRKQNSRLRRENE
jgi:hypothetical protein